MNCIIILTFLYSNSFTSLLNPMISFMNCGVTSCHQAGTSISYLNGIAATYELKRKMHQNACYYEILLQICCKKFYQHFSSTS